MMVLHKNPLEVQTKSSAQSSDSGRFTNRFFRAVAYVSALLILVILTLIAVFLFIKALPAFNIADPAITQTIESLSGNHAHNFLEYVGPLVFGTVLVSFLSLAMAFFVSIGIALFISHYAPKPLADIMKSVIDLLAAIPSVIYGLWGSLILVPAIDPLWTVLSNYLGFIPIFAGPAAHPARSVATVAVVLTVMIIPIITVIVRDIFAQTPRLTQEAALALGATKWEMITMSVLPFSRSAIVSASILALGRALGETMAVLMILSPGTLYSFHILQASQNQTIAANIAAQYPEANNLGVSTLIATGLILFVITLLVNYCAHVIVRRQGVK